MKYAHIYSTITTLAVNVLVATPSIGLAGGPEEVRGTWLTTTGPDHIRSGLERPHRC